jgi:hypothetical protein
VTTLLLLLILLFILLTALYVVVARPDLVTALVRRALRNADPWSRRSRLLSRLLVIKRADPEAFATVPDPVDEHFDTTTSDHPGDCAQACCWEIRLTEMHDAFDWGAYEYEMRKTK